MPRAKLDISNKEIKTKYKYRLVPKLRTPLEFNFVQLGALNVS